MATCLRHYGYLADLATFPQATLTYLIGTCLVRSPPWPLVHSPVLEVRGELDEIIGT